MTTQDFQKKRPLVIFLQYFKNHKKLFAIDLLCACLIAGVDLAFPLITRSALYDMLPGKMYKTFFIVMAAVVLCYVVRSLLNFTVTYFGHIFGIRVEAPPRTGGAGPPRPGGFAYLFPHHPGRADRYGLCPVAAGADRFDHDPHIPCAGDEYAPADGTGLCRIQGKNRLYQSGNRSQSVRCPHRQGFCQRKRRGSSVRQCQ